MKVGDKCFHSSTLSQVDSKAICFADAREELYDLKNDPFEAKNLLGCERGASPSLEQTACRTGQAQTLKTRLEPFAFRFTLEQWSSAFVVLSQFLLATSLRFRLNLDGIKVLPTHQGEPFSSLEKFALNHQPFNIPRRTT
jgi:hypothetical protein